MICAWLADPQAKAPCSQTEIPPIALRGFPQPALAIRQLRRWHFKTGAGDTADVILSSVAHNPRPVLARLRLPMRPRLIALASCNPDNAQSGLTAD
jgi:hypothetical protein